MSTGVASGVSASPEDQVSRGDVIYASIVAFVAWVFSVYDYILFGMMLPVITLAFHWTTATGVAVNTWIGLTAFIVSLSVGPIADYFGRRNGLMLVTAGAALSSGLTALGLGTVYTIIVRSFSGFGISEQAINTTYMAEIYGKESRGFSYSWIQGGWSVGAILAATSSAVLLPVLGWRGVFAVATIPAIIIVILRMRLKESPRFIHMQEVRNLIREGRMEEAKALGEVHGIAVERATRFTYRQLFGSDMARHTVFIAAAYGLQWVATAMISLLSTTILTQGKGISFANSLGILILANTAGFIGYIVFGYVGDRISRRNIVLAGWFLTALSWVAMLQWAHSIAAVITLYAIAVFFLNGTYAPFFSYTAESFPTRMRATGAAFVNAIGGIGGMVGSGLFGVLLSHGMSVLSAGTLVGTVPMVIAAAMLFGARNVPPRKKLEEISV